MKNLTNLTIKLVDFSGLKQGLESLIEHGNADLIRSCILETFTSDDEYQKVLWYSVIEKCFPQYLHLVNTVLVFG